MKFPLFTSVFYTKKCFERLSKTFYVRQSYPSNVSLIQTINKVQVMHFHDTSKTATTEWHKTNDLDFLKISKIFSDSDSDRLQKVVDEIKFASEGINRSPEFISSEQLRQLCKTETRSQRHKFLLFLFKKEKLKIADVKKKEMKRAEREKFEQTRTDDPSVVYGYNTLIPRVRISSIKNYYSKRLANAALFGKKIVVDLSYDQYMIEKERKACVAQLQVIYSVNRKNIDPFDLYFCNANPDSICVQYLKKYSPNISDSFISLTKESYLDIFPKESLVYLSPHAEETLKEYNPDAIYVIGAFVDTVKKEHLSLHKAEEGGIKSYSLPLDDYIMWGAGTKSLTINQAFEIMLTLKNTGDWIKALECVPTRKIRKLDPQQIENQDLTHKIYLTNS